MHILLGIIAAVGGLIFWLYRINNTYQGGKQLYEDGKNLYADGKAYARRSAWNRQKDYNPTDDLVDPRQVATLLMLETAKCSGEITTDQKDKIKQVVMEHFQFTESQAVEMMAHVSYLTQDVSDVENILIKILKPIHTQLSLDEKKEMIAMLREVAAHGSDIDPYQERFIGIIKTKIINTAA